MNDHQLSSLLKVLYEAASDEQQWNSFLAEFSIILRASSAVLVEDQSLIGTYQIDTAYVETYEQHYAPKNVYVQSSGHLLQTGAAFIGQTLCPDADLEKSEYYNEYLRPQDIFHAIAAIVFKRDNRFVHIAAVRPKRRQHFSDEDLALVRFLMPHFQSALRVRERFLSFQARHEAVLATLDRVPFGIFLLDGAGRVIEWNCVASAILRSADGISLSKGELRTARADESKALRKLVQQAVAVYAQSGLDAGGIARISRRFGRRPYCVHVTPFRAESRMGASLVSGAVFVSDPEASSVPPATALQRYYQLTPAEAKLACLLFAGQSLQEAACSLAVSMNTIRTHLKAILAKTGTRRQGELIRLLLMTFLPYFESSR